MFKLMISIFVSFIAYPTFIEIPSSIITFQPFESSLSTTRGNLLKESFEFSSRSVLESFHASIDTELFEHSIFIFLAIILSVPSLNLHSQTILFELRSILTNRASALRASFIESYKSISNDHCVLFYLIKYISQLYI